jgi:hypothetical protein
MSCFSLTSQDTLSIEDRVRTKYNSKGTILIDMYHSEFLMDYNSPRTREGRFTTDDHAVNLGGDIQKFIGERFALGARIGFTHASSGKADKVALSSLYFEPSITTAVPFPRNDILITAYYQGVYIYGSDIETTGSDALGFRIAYPLFNSDEHWNLVLGGGGFRVLDAQGEFKEPRGEGVAISLQQKLLIPKYSGNTNSKAPFYAGSIMLSGSSGVYWDRYVDFRTAPYFSPDQTFVYSNDVYRNLNMELDGAWYFFENIGLIGRVHYSDVSLARENIPDNLDWRVDATSTLINYSLGLRVHPLSNGFFIQAKAADFQREASTLDHDVSWASAYDSDLSLQIAVGHSLELMGNVHLLSYAEYGNFSPVNGIQGYSSVEHVRDLGLNVGCVLVKYW